MIERALNATWVLVGAGGLALSWRLGFTGPSGPDSGFFPGIASAIVLVVGIVLFVRGEHVTGIEWPDRAGWKRIAGVVGGLVFMCAVVPYLGFAITGVLTMLILLRTVEQSSWWSSIGLSLGSVGAVLWLFGYMLELQLPRGPWGW